ncbi:hypothetical protein [Actinomadura sp. B10D3]|uniref:hypothetical protein n=1 Tax=Actinomadura sp. B10D3 TaxID=3153557 RepID=UPI00325C910E
MQQPTRTVEEPVWFAAADGYEIRLEGTELVCRDDQGRVCEPIPRQVLESRFYPAWALIHDPGDAEAALGIVAGLERASRKKSSDAASSYEWMARDLPASHLPVFWEHVGRALITAGDAKRAATAFGRAREAEKAQALPVDGTVWLEAHLEFAAAGALSAKTAGGFVAGLRDRFEPEHALEALVELAMVRTRNGSPPWPELARQLTSLARAAGRDATAEQQKLIERLLPLPAVREAPFALWKAWRPALVPLAKSSPRVRALLLDLFPRVDDIDGWWLELLDESTALAALTGEAAADGVEPLDGAAGWLTRAVVHPQRVTRNRVGRPIPRQLTALIPRMSARLAAEGVPVRLDGPDRWDGPHGWDRYLRVIKVRVLEACLAHGVPVAAPTKEALLGLADWMRDRDPDEDIPALAAHPDFAPLLREALDRYRDKGDLARVPALHSLLQTAAGERRTGVDGIPRHPLDDAEVERALYGLAPYGFGNTGMLHGVQITGGLLDGSLDPNDLEADWFPVSSRSWRYFIGRIGAVALRAVAASTRHERRERLLALLEVWAETPFAAPDARLRVGVAETEPADRTVVHDEHGVAVRLDWAGEGRHHFIGLRTGAAEAPAPGPIVEVAGVPQGWGGAGRLRHLVSLVRDRGPMPWDREAVALLAERTGLSRAAATLTLAGIPGRDSYSPPFLDADERKILRITAAEADDACGELRKLTTEQRLDLLADVLPADPADLWKPGALRDVAERVAEKWVTWFGRKPRVPEETLTAARTLTTTMSAAEMCATLSAPHTVPALTTDLNTWLQETDHYGCETTSGNTQASTFYVFLTDLGVGVRWAYAELPAGDPVRNGAPEAVELLRARLDHPGLLLSAGSLDHGQRTIEDLRGRFGDKPYRGPSPLGVDSVDDGLTIATFDKDRRGDLDPSLFFRPSLFGDDARSRLLLAALWCKYADLRAVEWLRSGGCTRMMERIRANDLPEGAYEANPRASVPDLVAQVGERFGLEPDPAALYLQLLTLLEPTDRNVRRWNGWKPDRHKNAITALTGRGMVIEAKRARAGRGVFLPGTWAKGDKSHLPMEAWKAQLYGLSLSFDGDKVWGDFQLSRPLPDLYADAWQRILDGDQPG